MKKRFVGHMFIIFLASRPPINCPRIKAKAKETKPVLMFLQKPIKMATNIMIKERTPRFINIPL